MGGLCFEDFAIGKTFTTTSRTITGDEVLAFANLTGDTHPLHVDPEFARASPFGEQIAHGLLGLSVAAGLGIQTGVFADCMIAFLGLEDWRFLLPIKFGDSIHMVSTVVEARRTSRGDTGVIKLQQDVINQHGELVQQGRFVSLVTTRTSAIAGAAV
jgi:acyl dehydratase